MRILVTGGVGFIGSALAKRLHDEGNDVLVVDNFNEYYDVELKHTRQKELLDGIEVVKGDIIDESFLDSLFAAHDFEVVCHLAAQAGVRYSVDHPSEYVLSNVLGTQILLETMKNHGVNQMVYASTSSAYGVSSETPFQETENADRPVSVYASTKRAGELLAHSYHVQYQMNITCLRFFTVYGPWSRPDMAMLKFAELMTEGKPIDVYNNGDLRRDFTHISDIVDGFVRAVQTPLGYEVINLGRGEPTELFEYIKLIEKSLDLTAKMNMLPMQQGDVYETYADTKKAKDLLGFEAMVGIEEGIQTFTDWYKKYYLHK